MPTTVETAGMKSDLGIEDGPTELGVPRSTLTASDQVDWPLALEARPGRSPP
jgi:hypothetical protein